MALDKFQPYLFVSAGEQSNKYLTPVISPEGIASFQAQRAQDLTGLTIRIDPIQEGTGDPSPTNVRPISGRTGMTVTRAGENLFTPLNARNTTARDVNVVSDGNGTITMTGTATANDYVSLLFPSPIIIPDGAIFKFCLLNTQASSESIFRFVNGSTIVDSWSPNVVNREMNYSGMSGKEVTGVRIYITNGTTYNMTMQPMFVPKTVSVNGYIPYTATTYPITWETESGTVYGGTLDVVSGVLTVDSVMKQITADTANITKFGDGVRISGFCPEAMQWGQIVCSHGTSDQSKGSNVLNIRAGANNQDFYWYYILTTLGLTTVEEFQTWLSNNPVTVVFKVTTPQTYQLTPTEVRTIAGFNQIYSDAGPIIDIKF